MREDWVNYPLEKHIKFIDYRGRTPEKTPDGMRLITAKNVKMGFLQLEPREFVDPNIYERWMTRGIPKKDDVLFTTEAPLGNVAQLDTSEMVIFAQRVIILQPDRDVLNPTFLKYILLSRNLQLALQENATGATAKGIKASLLKKIQIPIPSLPEQQRIVAILDEAFAAIATATANAERNLVNARALFESYLDSAIESIKNADNMLLAQLCHRDRIITYGVIKLGEQQHNGIPCLRTSNVRWLHIDTDGIKHIASNLSAEYKRTILHGGEVLVNVRGTLGGVAIVPDFMSGWNVSREVAVIPVDHKLVNPEFLAYYIGARTSQTWLTGVLKGVAYTGINIKDLRNLPVIVPEMNIQLQLIERLKYMQSKIESIRFHYEKKLTLLAELKQSILHKAFTGELTADPQAAETILSDGGL